MGEVSDSEGDAASAAVSMGSRLGMPGSTLGEGGASAPASEGTFSFTIKDMMGRCAWIVDVLGEKIV